MWWPCFFGRRKGMNAIKEMKGGVREMRRKRASREEVFSQEKGADEERSVEERKMKRCERKGNGKLNFMICST